MKRITTTGLQHEFGLPFQTAELIIREQTTLARQHYRHWQIVVIAMFSAYLALSFAPDDTPWYRASRYLLPLNLLAFAATEILIQRHARDPILAAARAATVHAG
jgi:hypothetical protein